VPQGHEVTTENTAESSEDWRGIATRKNSSERWGEKRIGFTRAGGVSEVKTNGRNLTEAFGRHNILLQQTLGGVNSFGPETAPEGQKTQERSSNFRATSPSGEREGGREKDMGDQDSKMERKSTAKGFDTPILGVSHRSPARGNAKVKTSQARAEKRGRRSLTRLTSRPRGTGLGISWGSFFWGGFKGKGTIKKIA